MSRAFLYIAILGFENLVRTNPDKVDQVFEIFDTLKVYKHFALQTVVFSDTILVFNKDESLSKDYYCAYLVECVQELFYRLSAINVYFNGILTYGEFHFSRMTNIQAYYADVFQMPQLHKHFYVTCNPMTTMLNLKLTAKE